MTISLNGTTGITTPDITSAAGFDASVLTGQVPDANAPSGSVLQVVQASVNIKATINSAAIKVMEASISTSVANSKLLALVSCSIGGVDTYSDYDLAIALGYRTGSAGSSSTDYTAIHGAPYSRQTISGLGSFFVCDTQRAAGPGGQYWAEEKSYFKIISPNQSASTAIYVALWAGTDTTYYFGTPGSSILTDSGAEMSITLMEIAP